ncbi:MAG TPA: pitrilysin family protein [Mycobacteriales bacterium]|nr:pitrilysin family protein [Mycobacteriales bacterium]
MTGPPTSGPARPYHFPRFERVAVAGGGTLIAAHMPGRPMATALLVVDAGAVTEPPGREGVALLTARMLAEGTTRRDAFAFAVAAERLGASWSADADYDSMRVGFDVPADELPAAVDLLGEAVREPAFGAEAYARVGAERVDELAVEWSQPGPRAGAAFAAALWAPESRYARRDGGEPQTVAAVSRSDVVDFHAARVRPERSTLVVAGDLSGLDPSALAERMFAGWTAAAPAGAVVPDPASARDGGRRVVVVDRPGSVQSMLVLGHPAPPRTTPDYVAMSTMALAFAGMFGSRINYRLREEKGYTYGMFGGFELRRHGGIFALRAAVQREVTAAALGEAIAELQRTAAGGITAAELEIARNYRVGVFPVSFAQPHAVAGALGDLVIHQLPDDYFDRVRSDVAAVGLDAVNEAAATRLLPDRLVSVVVGDADGLDGPLDSFGAVERSAADPSP